PTLLDRLTRFEPAYIRYKRVFDDIINKFCLDEKAKNLTLEDEIQYVEEIFNSSLKAGVSDDYINDILTDLEEKYFNFNQESYQYLSARLNIQGMIDEIEITQNSPKNLIWLKEISKNKKNITQLRGEKSLLYPIEKIILCEGQTEFVLLETIFNLFNLDLNKLGIYTIAAGGKNQVARKYYQMIEQTKIPFFILLDKDAQPIKELIEAKIRPNDKIYLINSGEFEDLIPKNILQRTINSVHCNDLNCIFDDFNDELSMVDNLENIYKKYGFGEFKKAKFALELKEYIEKNISKEDFKNSEIIDIIENLK
ncbi:MAG: ATP-dependent endonuclease, partial [Candidatus Gastranaerophilales bacterium]|nr:ATP-dependent endonuclease [Candidatus Gastranaerophilales bacterium]